MSGGGGRETGGLYNEAAVDPDTNPRRPGYLYSTR